LNFAKAGMNRNRPVSLWLQIVLSVMVFGAVVWLALQSRAELTEAVLVPLLYVLWVGKVAIKSFDQHYIWLLTVVVALVLSLFLTHQKTRSRGARPPKGPTASQEVGRIAFWRSQIRVSSSGTTRRFRRAQLRRLLINALAYRQNKNNDEILAELHSGQLSVPPEVGYILGVKGSQNKPVQHLGFKLFLKQKFSRIKELVRKPEFKLDPRLKIVAEYLDQLLEADDDIKNR
jgi:hypothetical protein